MPGQCHQAVDSCAIDEGKEDSKLLIMKHENEALWQKVANLPQKHAQQQKVVKKLIPFLISLEVKRKIPLMLSESTSAYSVPKYGPQYSLEHVHGPGPYLASSPAYSSSSLYSSNAVTSSGPIISDITEQGPTSLLASPGRRIDERVLFSSTLVHVKEELPSPPRSPWVLEASPGCPSSMDILLSPTAFIDSILRESEPTPAASNTAPMDTTRAQAPALPTPSTPEKCLSVSCLDNNEVSDHLDVMDSNLDNMKTMLTSHGFSEDTSVLLDLFSTLGVTVPDMSLPDLDNNLARIQEPLSPQEPPRPLEAKNSNANSGKRLVQYTAQPLLCWKLMLRTQGAVNCLYSLS